MYQLSNVLEYACDKHKGQVDKSGKPYILHPVQVSLGVTSQQEKAVAFLHDVLEDTNATIEELYRLGLGEDEIEAIKLLTKEKYDDYFSYVDKLKSNTIARHVKMSDLRHNMDLTRLSNVTEKDLARVKKYKKAYSILENEENKKKE